MSWPQRGRWDSSQTAAAKVLRREDLTEGQVDEQSKARYRGGDVEGDAGSGQIELRRHHIPALDGLRAVAVLP